MEPSTCTVEVTEQAVAGGSEETDRVLGELHDGGRMMVLATHNVDEGAELATDVAFQRRGRFVHFAPRGTRSAAEIAAAYRRAMADG